MLKITLKSTIMIIKKLRMPPGVLQNQAKKELINALMETPSLSFRAMAKSQTGVSFCVPFEIATRSKPVESP